MTVENATRAALEDLALRAHEALTQLVPHWDTDKEGLISWVDVPWPDTIELDASVRDQLRETARDDRAGVMIRFELEPIGAQMLHVRALSEVEVSAQDITALEAGANAWYLETEGRFNGTATTFVDPKVGRTLWGFTCAIPVLEEFATALIAEFIRVVMNAALDEFANVYGDDDASGFTVLEADTDTDLAYQSLGIPGIAYAERTTSVDATLGIYRALGTRVDAEMHSAPGGSAERGTYYWISFDRGEHVIMVRADGGVMTVSVQFASEIIGPPAFHYHVMSTFSAATGFLGSEFVSVLEGGPAGEEPVEPGQRWYVLTLCVSRELHLSDDQLVHIIMLCANALVSAIPHVHRHELDLASDAGGW